MLANAGTEWVLRGGMCFLYMLTFYFRRIPYAAFNFWLACQWWPSEVAGPPGKALWSHWHKSRYTVSELAVLLDNQHTQLRCFLHVAFQLPWRMTCKSPITSPLSLQKRPAMPVGDPVNLNVTRPQTIGAFA
jgi:hypothetical protein